MEPSRFTQNATKVLNAEPKDMGKGKYINAKCNPFKQDTDAFGYLPYLTLYTALRGGGYVTELRIQFSASKIIRDNNFDEIDEVDFDQVCKRVFEGLKYYGIRLYDGVETIANARTDVVNYSKNFVLDNYMSARQVTQELQKVDVNSWRDVSKTDYINNGHGIKAHSKYFELVFYDKIAEYHKGKRRQPTFDKDLQLAFDLFHERDFKQPFEVVRMEVRLGNGKAIKQAFERANIEPGGLSFRDIYNAGISKKILQWYLSDLYDHSPKITEAQTDSVLELFSDLYTQNPHRNMSTLVGAIGLYSLNKEAGLRAMKDIVGSRGSPALLRLARRTNKELLYNRQKSEVFELLDKQLDRFEPVYLKDYEK